MEVRSCGRVARATSTGSQFGEELDSLVDAISFGVAPALIIYHLFLTDGIWSWTASFIYVAAAVVRLARFNIEQAGHAKVAFHGLPSPTAGMTLATFYPFSRTEFFQQNLAQALDWPIAVTVLMILLGGLMMSHILYPVVPKFGVRTAKGLFTLLLMLVSIVAAFTIPALFFFPMAMLYITYGIVKALVMGFIDRMPERDPLLDEEPGDEDPRHGSVRKAALHEQRCCRVADGQHYSRLPPAAAAECAGGWLKADLTPRPEDCNRMGA